MIEVHDAAAPAELMAYEDIGFAIAAAGRLTSEPGRRGSAASTSSTRAAVCSPRVIRSARPGSRRSWRSASSCAGGRGIVR